MKEILVPVAPADLIDRLTQLRLIAQRADNPLDRAGITRREALLQRAADRALPCDDRLEQLWEALYQVNADLCAIEDDMRAFEDGADFGPAFIALARSIFVTCDDRNRIKTEINVLLGSVMASESPASVLGARGDH